MLEWNCQAICFNTNFIFGYTTANVSSTRHEWKVSFSIGHSSLVSFGVQYDLLNVLNGCKMALRTLDFSQQLRCYARGKRALLKLFGRDSLGVTAKLGTRLRSRIYVVMGPWKQRSFHQYSYYRAISVTHSVYQM